MVGTLYFYCYSPDSTPDWEDPIQCVAWQKKKRWTENRCVFFHLCILGMHLQSNLNICVTVYFLKVSVLLCLLSSGMLDPDSILPYFLLD